MPARPPASIGSDPPPSDAAIRSERVSGRKDGQPDDDQEHRAFAAAIMICIPTLRASAASVARATASIGCAGEHENGDPEHHGVEQLLTPLAISAMRSVPSATSRRRVRQSGGQPSVASGTARRSRDDAHEQRRFGSRKTMTAEPNMVGPFYWTTITPCAVFSLYSPTKG
jgi:hypothetical protein